MGAEFVQQLTDHLGLSSEQRRKLELLDAGNGSASAANISQTISTDTDANGYLDYKQSITTVFPIGFTARWTVKQPTNGSWEVWVYLNGKLIDHKSGVVPNQTYQTSGKTGWGTSALEVKGQWSEHTRAHVVIDVSI